MSRSQQVIYQLLNTNGVLMQVQCFYRAIAQSLKPDQSDLSEPPDFLQIADAP